MKKYTAVATIFLCTFSAKVGAVPIKPNDHLHQLTAVDIKSVDSEGYCEATIAGKPVYHVNMISKTGVVRYNNIKYVMKSSDDTDFEYEAFTPNFPMDEMPFGIEIHRIRELKSSEVSWSIAAKMVIHGTTGAAWASYPVQWACYM